MTYRALKPADLPAVTNLFVAEEELSPYASAALKDDLLAGWLAIDGSHIVGAVLTRIMRSDDGAERGGVDELVVASGYRGRGIGRRLMQLAEAHYHTLGVAGMQLSVAETNEPAVHLYESLSYAVVKRYLRPGRAVERTALPESRLRMWKDF